MAFMDTLRRLERLAHLINRKGTGTREDLSQKLEVSVRTVDNLIQQLRNLCEVEIYFCPARGSYCFCEEVDVRFEYVIPQRNTGKIKGGNSFISCFFAAADFLRQRKVFLYC